MGAGSNGPYMYAPSTRYSTAYPQSVFDPKAVSRASLIPPAPRPKQEGPLIDFNKHPDSWIIRPYAKPEIEGMNPNIKKIVNYTRGTQLGLRLCQILLAIGLLFCTVCTRNIAGTNAWVMRIPPGFDILVTGYGIYHLVRSATHRTPASSASYHFFALVMDAGFIPFYVFTALLARAEYLEKPNTYGRWTTVFHGEFRGVSATNIILHFTWILAIVAGSFHLVTFAISSYLAYVFREITQMPPDMNPLEENLTSRRKSKHRYKNSEVSEKHFSKGSESSFSLVSPVRSTGSQDLLKNSGRPVSFFHTRTESDISYSPHNPRTANASRVDLPLYQRPSSSRASRVDLHRRENSQSPAKSTTTYSSEPSHLKSLSSSVYSGDSIPIVPPKSSKRELQSDNWFVPNNDENAEPSEDCATSEVSRNDYAPSITNESTLSSASQPHSYQRLNQTNAQEESNWTKVPLDTKPVYSRHQDRNFMLQPLGMNPPTPRVSIASQAIPRGNDAYSSYDTQATGRPLTNKSGNSVRPKQSSVAAPKSKYYGDLMAATQGIRGSSPSSSPAGSPSKASPERSRGGEVRKTNNVSNREDERGRVLSNSGTDPSAAYSKMEDTWGGNGRRDVSGKVVEEGRGGWRRRISLRRQG